MNMIAAVAAASALIVIGVGAFAAEVPFVLSSADTMEKVFRDEPSTRPAAERLYIEAARDEVEGVQLLVIAQQRDLASVRLDIGELRGPSGSTIGRQSITWRPVGYVHTEKPAYAAPKVGWWPDPLLPTGEFDIQTGRVQPVWINVRVPADARPGVYLGTVTVVAAGVPSRSLPLEVRVWDFAVPRQQHLESSFVLRPRDLAAFYKLNTVPIEMYERWIDFCVDHRISLTLCDWPNYQADMERLVSRQLDRGGSAFCLGYASFREGTPQERAARNAQTVARLKDLAERARKRGWLDRAYIYCHDEIAKEQFELGRELYTQLKSAMPDVRLMQTFYKDEPVPVLEDVMDIWAPNTARYRADEFHAQQARGKGTWWYVCCGPWQPFANMMIEWPGTDHRLLPWQNWKYGVNGFLYWGVNVWRDNLVGERRWPQVPWNPATWRNDKGQAHNGDGQLIYPGPDQSPLGSIRLENLRDGMEDYEYLWLLRQALDRLKARGAAAERDLIAEAEKALSIDEALVRDMTHFSHDPQVLRQARANVARLIELTQAAARR